MPHHEVHNNLNQESRVELDVTRGPQENHNQAPPSHSKMLLFSENSFNNQPKVIVESSLPDESSMIRDEEVSQILKDKMNTTIVEEKPRGAKLNKTTIGMQVILESQNETQSFIENDSPDKKQELTTEEKRIK